MSYYFLEDDFVIDDVKTYTSKTWEDFDFDNDGTFKWDCCNIDYCKVHRKSAMRKQKYACLRGNGRSADVRCLLEEKQRIRDEAFSKGFNFPHDST